MYSVIMEVFRSDSHQNIKDLENIKCHHTKCYQHTYSRLLHTVGLCTSILLVEHT